MAMQNVFLGASLYEITLDLLRSYEYSTSHPHLLLPLTLLILTHTLLWHMRHS